MKNFNLAFWFYIPNIIMVSIDVCLYFRNLKLDQAADAASAEPYTQFSSGAVFLTAPDFF